MRAHSANSFFGWYGFWFYANRGPEGCAAR